MLNRCLKRPAEAGELMRSFTQLAAAIQDLVAELPGIYLQAARFATGFKQERMSALKSTQK
jgi:trehalose-6-phosphatase